MNRVIYFLCLLLALTGAAFIFSASGELYLVGKHAVFFLLSSILFVLIQQRRLQFFSRSTFLVVAYVGTILALVMVLLFGHEVNGATRWIRVGPISLQMSEFAKVGTLGFFAYFADRLHQPFAVIKYPALALLIFAAVPLSLLYLEPDYGTIVLMILTLGGVLFASDFPIKQLAVLMVAAGLILGFTVGRADYRRSRIEAYVNPWKFRYEAGYQTTASYRALGSGGWTGVGYREGHYKGRRLPEAQNDYVLAVVGEERGLLGIVVILLLYMSLAGLTLRQVVRHLNGWQQLFGIGVFLLTVGTVAMNMMVVGGLLPAKGIALPLVSAGGSSMLAFVLMYGLVARYLKEATA